MTPSSSPPGPEERPQPPREELERQVRDHYGNWRDQPRGLACAVVAAFLLLTTAAFAFAVVAVVMAAR
ncbi:hypothetical protein [Actinomadura rugatobispora]|uniref:Uncharacterized protein n=1 Tax=Actinomadura rugatobispora TaxID=1994 RepID=A0ABW0ZNH9_9ACTN|nr:hypothetical protein GCM10010200_058660 [Actinomadura rugatobispora]